MPYRAPDGTLQDVLPLVESETGIGVIPVEVSDAKGEFGTAPGAIPARIVSGPYLDADGTLQEPIPIMIDGSGYDPDAEAFFERLTTPPTTERKALYNTLIVDLKTAGVWGKLDALYILAANDAQAARQNLVANAYNLAAVGSPAFAADRGYTGDGVGACLTSGMIPASSPGLKYTLNQASLLAWVRSDNSGSYCSIGSGSGSFIGSIRPRNSGSLTVITNGAGTVTATVPTSVGLSAWSRANDTTATLYKNGALLSSPANASTGLSVDQFRFLSLGGFTQFSIDQVAVGGIGGALTAPEHAALYSALNTYLTAVGAA